MRPHFLVKTLYFEIINLTTPMTNYKKYLYNIYYATNTKTT